ncbi:MAG: hypothetical protein KA007_00855 [Candidatus Pacebacteria bacterium]|nr:hypothetical protein [Candidatus Paceibacterota bacterium]
MDLSDIFKNLKTNVFKNKDKIDLIRKIISKKINFEIKEDEIILTGDSVKLNIHPSVKHEIKIKKEEILLELKESNIFLSNIF